jgi:hypothetical protein
MAIVVQFTNLRQVPPFDPVTAKVQVGFRILGPEVPDRVEIYASVDPGKRGTLVDSVEISTPDPSGDSLVDVPAGKLVSILLCPRTVTNGVLDDEIDGQPFEVFCVVNTLTTKASDPGSTQHPNPPPPPTITSMTSRQFTLHERSSFFISWSSEQCDNYHLSWRLVKPVPGSTNSGNVQEIAAPPNFTFTSRIFESQPGEVYEAQVQACRHVDLGNDLCSPFSTAASLTIPENTRSLRQFLLLSKVSLPNSVRGIGVAGSIRRLLRV